ncbi:glycosyltransferase [Halosquirtibacter xylanolyticus]|uniref:glycosyltransferase n=1 Tax=Halosquirtibacter xylanolyticus TaxID=3374599 RepID=UPI00374863DC|nr:glycosyltransferase [Prolixibacteraceae bacterium]
MSDKVLQVNKYYSPDIGGVETVVKQYSEFLHENKFEVCILCVNKDFTLKTKIEVIDGINVVRCASLGTYFSMPISFIFYYYYIKLALRSSLIHFHEPFPLASVTSLFSLIGLFRKKKIIVTWHSDIIKQKILKGFVEFFQSLLLRRADVITTTSPNMIKFSKLLQDYSYKVKVLPLSIEVKDTITEDDSYILYLGRLSYYKGIDILLKAYDKSVTSLKLVIVGDGESSIVDLVNEYREQFPDKIIFKNFFVTEEEKWEMIKNCSFFVFPSVQPSEAFGIIQLEAMICSKPVINTNLPTGVPFVSLDKITGITVEPNNVDELSKAIDKLSFDIDYRIKLGNNACERVKTVFSDHIVLDSLLKIYNNK